jgi:histone acetyltransferase MYST1
MGQFKIGTWYYSPYPDEYKEVDTLYLCEFCLKYMKMPATLVKHKVLHLLVLIQLFLSVKESPSIYPLSQQKECKNKGPPGKIVYSKTPHKVFEVDGKEHPLYCQNLCLLSKLFLDHKTVYFDIAPFWFYVLTEAGYVDGHPVDRIVGYFSKEKKSYEDNNLACIMTLPHHQKKGYGRMLIEFSEFPFHFRQYTELKWLNSYVFYSLEKLKAMNSLNWKTRLDHLSVHCLISV